MDYSICCLLYVVFVCVSLYHTIPWINLLFQNGRALLKCRIFILLHCHISSHNLPSLPFPSFLSFPLSSPLFPFPFLPLIPAYNLPFPSSLLPTLSPFISSPPLPPYTLLSSPFHHRLPFPSSLFSQISHPTYPSHPLLYLSPLPPITSLHFLLISFSHLSPPTSILLTFSTFYSLLTFFFISLLPFSLSSLPKGLFIE